MNARPIVGKVKHRNLGTVIGEAGCEGVTELAKAAGDDHDAILEIEPVHDAYDPRENE